MAVVGRIGYGEVSERFEAIPTRLSSLDNTEQ